MIDIAIGTKFTRLTVLSKEDSRKGHTMYRCLCDCGTEKIIRGSALLCKNTSSCGCLNSELAAKWGRDSATHKMSKSPEFNSWRHLIARCYNKKNAKYKNYGARGIKVCDRWLNSFENFFSDMGKKPSSNHSIDRRDNDGNYEPSNCRWGTMQQQASNKTYTVRIPLSSGATIHQAGLAKELGITPHAIEYHLEKGKTGDEIISHFKNKKYANTV